MRWRVPALLLGLAAASPAAADQLIQIPTADITRGVRGEYLHRFEGEDRGYGTLLAGVASSYELMFRHYNNFSRDYGLEGGGQFQLLPDGLVTPGLAVGVWDITNSGPFGRRFFFVATKWLEKDLNGLPDPIQRVQLTLGAGSGRFAGPMAGLRVELPARVSLVAEYDARRLNAGLWFAPVRPLRLKAELQNGDLFLGGDFRVAF